MITHYNDVLIRTRSSLNSTRALLQLQLFPTLGAMPSGSRTIAAARAYDHVYDPVYTVADGRDHARAHAGATRGHIERVPQTANMFSEIPLYPNHAYRQSTKDDLPKHVDRSFKGAAKSEASTSGVTLERMIEGTNRYRYFRRPIVPYLEAVPPEVLLAAAPDMDMLGDLPPAHTTAPSGPTRTVGVQTMYRESEAQTDPYTPDYTVRPGDEPEVLTLATLNHMNGLPAGLGQVEMIERARNKRLFEMSLPPMTDEANLELRKRMVSEQELRDWKSRESEIDSLQAERLELLQSAILQRNKESEFVTEQRVEALRQQRLEEKERAIAEIQRQRIKALRKLSKARKAVDPNPLKRDIIAEYSNFASEAYAPILVKGKHPDHKTLNFEVAPSDTKTIEGLVNLERTVPRHLVVPTTIRPDSTLEKSHAARVDKVIASHLDEMDQLLRSAKSTDKSERPATPPPAWKRKVERVIRPPTPTVTDGDEALDEYTNSIILLQKLLRGRAVQNRMFEGKEKRSELIKELRISEPLSLASTALAAADAVEASETSKKESIETAVEAVHIEVVASMLDFMSKHLVRMKAERRVAALVSRAENERRMREAAEGGRRQAEAIVRAREEIIFNQLMNTQQATVESYLDAIISESVDRSATAGARKEMNLRPATATPPSGTDGEDARDALVVRQLVGSFLLPELDRKRAQDLVNQREAKYLKAARSVLESVEHEVKLKLTK